MTLIIKKCPKCGLIAEFYKNCGYCKKCNAIKSKQWKEKNPEKAYILSRDSYDRSLYGIPAGTREKMLKDQNGLCAICGNPPSTKRGLYLDHDHETGQVRGLLCHGCNIAIGNFGDDIELMQRAIKYLSAFGK